MRCVRSIVAALSSEHRAVMAAALQPAAPLLLPALHALLPSLLGSPAGGGQPPAPAPLSRRARHRRVFRRALETGAHLAAFCSINTGSAFATSLPRCPPCESSVVGAHTSSPPLPPQVPLPAVRELLALLLALLPHLSSSSAAKLPSLASRRLALPRKASLHSEMGVNSSPSSYAELLSLALTNAVAAIAAAAAAAAAAAGTTPSSSSVGGGAASAGAAAAAGADGVMCVSLRLLLLLADPPSPSRAPPTLPLGRVASLCGCTPKRTRA